MTPSCTSKMALAVLCLVDMTQSVFLYIMGLSPLANPEPLSLLDCFLRHLLFISCSLMAAFRTQLKISWDTKCFMCVRSALLPRRNAWAFWLLFPGGWVSCFFPTSPWVAGVSEDWCHWKSDHNRPAVTVYENPVCLAAHLYPVKSRGFHRFSSCPGYLPT